jgi:light-regulated signal transduction histidine kinase (bacteriophytochrome)
MNSTPNEDSAAASASATTIYALDASSCDREPIHIPGRVQAHGALVALEEPSLTVVQASANVEGLLGRPLDRVLGAEAGGLFDPDDAATCRAWLRRPDVREAGPMRLRAGGRAFDASAHRHDGVLILELENPGEADGPTPVLPDYQTVRLAMARLQTAPTLQEFGAIAAEVLRDLTGFDRAMVYRFDEEWNGWVDAEARRADIPPLLGQHFPASDIPAPARKMFDNIPIRLIADVETEEAPLVPEINPLTGRPLDLSRAVLRGVSPVHVQYNKNMGVRTSMSVPLRRDGRLWGLLSCLHYDGPKPVPPAVRDACVFLGELVSAQIAVKQTLEGLDHRSQLQAVRERLLQRMSAAEGDLVRGLAGEALLELTNATGAAIVYGGQCVPIGKAPDEPDILALVAWLRVHAPDDVFHTSSLPRLLPEASRYKFLASGLLAIRTTQGEGHDVLWFRPEVIQTTDWGGDPRKPVEQGAGPDGQVGPRRSFELWREVVRDTSLPWQPWEIDAASLLRDAIIAVVVRRAEELARLNSELERSNADLDAFAFITSHDLKEPLRGINNFATFVMEDYAEQLDSEGVEKLRTLVRLSQRLEDLVESLLRYSRLGRSDLAIQQTDLNHALSQALEVQRLVLDRDHVQVRVPRPLPVVRCDPTQAEILLTNLIANAVKYNDKPERAIEIGFIDPVDPSPAERSPVVYVRDNGIGIAEKHHESIFRMFKRLHARDAFGGGTGAGLAFARKIVERHGGRIWVESTPGVGSTFYFTLGSPAS